MAAVETEVAVLKTQTKTLHEDLDEMKSDIKEIKTLLSGNFVTVEQFEAYKKSQTFVKVVISCITAVITALLTFEITRIFRG
jgi:predicted  nucleic acid-binding Zn-ribbon protein